MLWREGDPGAGRVGEAERGRQGGTGEGRGRPGAYGKELWPIVSQRDTTEGT